jgi:hypothetical protein
MNSNYFQSSPNPAILRRADFPSQMTRRPEPAGCANFIYSINHQYRLLQAFFVVVVLMVHLKVASALNE